MMRVVCVFLIFAFAGVASDGAVASNLKVIPACNVCTAPVAKHPVRYKKSAPRHYSSNALPVLQD